MSDELDNKIQEFARAVASFEESYFFVKLSHFRQRCQSPIEILLLAGIIAESVIYTPDLRFGISNNHTPDHRPYNQGCIIIQAPVGEYVADFLIELAESDNVWLSVVVECDGHDFHERTKQQAAHDKQRDRWMQLNNILVVRFTGSEIWANARGCARQLLEILTEKAKIHFGR